jgi:hypothetical protein
MASQEIINVGTNPNDGQGDPLRVAFGKINNNFSNLFNTFVNTSNSYSIGNTTNQVIFQTPANTFSQAQVYIQTVDPVGTDSQTIQLYAQLSNDQTTVKFSGYGSTFVGTGLSKFDMDVSSGNVRILCSPIVNKTLLHFIGSQVMWIGTGVPGVELQLDGYTDAVLSTEDNFILTTED